MLVFYATVLVIFVNWNWSRTVVCRQLHVIHLPFTDHLISSHLSPAIYPIFRCCQTSGTSDLPEFSLLPDVCHQRFIWLFAAARRLAAATPISYFSKEMFAVGTHWKRLFVNDSFTLTRLMKQPKHFVIRHLMSTHNLHFSWNIQKAFQQSLSLFDAELRHYSNAVHLYLIGFTC